MRKVLLAVGVVGFLAYAAVVSPFNLDIWRDCRGEDGSWSGSYLYWSSRMAPGHWGFSSDSCQKLAQR